MEPVEGVLESAGDRALVERAAPEQPVRCVTGLDQPRGRLARLVVIRVVHGQIELAQIVGLGGSLARISKSRAALRKALEGVEAAGAETERDCQPLRNAHCS